MNSCFIHFIQKSREDTYFLIENYFPNEVKIHESFKIL
jgi:hypothetical protein